MEIANVSIFLAFAAGLVSIVSPCVLPLVPIYLAYLTGATAQDLDGGRARTAVPMLWPSPPALGRCSLKTVSNVLRELAKEDTR